MQKIYFVFLISLISLFSNAQNTNIIPFTLKANFKSLVNADLKDATGNFSQNEYNIGFDIPVYTHVFKNKTDKPAFYSFSFLNNNSILIPEIDFLNKTNTLFNLSIGIRGVYFTGNKNLWLSKISLNLFEDEYSIADPNPRFSGVFLFDRIVNKDFSYHLGIANKYSFGLVSILPVAGIKYNFTNKWKLMISLPFYCGIHYKANDKLLLSAKFNTSGAISYYSNRSMLFGQTQNLMLFRKKSNSFTLNGSYKLNNNLYITAGIGREGNRKIFFSDLKTEVNKDPSNFFSTSLDNTVFFNFGFIIKLAKKHNNIDNEEDILNRFDDEFGF